MNARFRGCLLGLAVGDALGYPVEFLNRSELRTRFGPQGLTDFIATSRHPAGSYSDDTQMTLAVAKALVASNLTDLDDIMRHVRDEFCAWAESPENDRAPGQTCLDGVRKLREGVHWFSSGDPYSKGNGAAMRAAPIGLVFSKRPERLIEVSRAIAISSHAHPTGVSSAIAAAAAVAYAVEGGHPDGLIAHLKHTLRYSRGPKGYAEVVDYDPLGEQLRSLEELERTLAAHMPADQAFDRLGGGWVGEEAVAGALYCYLSTPHDYRQTVLTGANASMSDETAPGKGRCDSDSVACIAGSVSGAALGLDALPTSWVQRVENRDLLIEMADALASKARGI